ncbi:hypothetical protein Droror1_Dr00023404 [Drosera rotundifolia]
MTFITMTSSFLSMHKQPFVTPCQRSVVVANAKMDTTTSVSSEAAISKRRDLVFAGAVAATYAIAKIAMAEEEPKRGSPEAKKKYAPVCITNPTARICRN